MRINRRQLIQGLSATTGLGLLPWQQGSALPVTPPLMDASKPLKRIAFGSCNKQEKSQRHFEQISYLNPDLWLWLGDIIYGDRLSISERAQTYQMLQSDRFYSRLSTQAPIMGTWDDHDFGYDNCDYSFGDRAASQQLLMDFLGLPANHPSRRRTGVYQNQTFGPQGQQTEVILLDVRYFRNDPEEGGGILGASQWQWLESTIRNSQADLLIIGTGTNVSSYFSGLGLEGWQGYPDDRDRLYDLLAEADIPSVIISGDRHHADISRWQLSSGRPCYEFMSSGLTHSSLFGPPNPQRLGRFIGWRNVGVIDISWQGTGPILNFKVVAPQNHRKIYTTVTTDFAYG